MLKRVFLSLAVLGGVAAWAALPAEANAAPRHGHHAHRHHGHGHRHHGHHHYGHHHGHHHGHHWHHGHHHHFHRSPVYVVPRAYAYPVYPRSSFSYSAPGFGFYFSR